jgi:hypothetical protein
VLELPRPALRPPARPPDRPADLLPVEALFFELPLFFFLSAIRPPR